MNASVGSEPAPPSVCLRPPVQRPREATGRHLIHVGYHKTASTWLQSCVFPHLAGVRYGDPLLNDFVRNLATARGSEFFAEGFRSVLRQIERLSRAPLLLSDEGLSGSLWDGHDTGFRNAARLHRVMPAARIMIVVRRQDEMLRSVHAQYVNEGGTGPLRAFLGREVEGSRFSLRHLEYDRLVARYVELFGRDCVWVMPYEHLRARRDRFLGGLCEFVGADLTAKVSRQWLNPSLSWPSLRLLRAWNQFFRASRFNPVPCLGPLPGGRRVRNLMQGRVDPIVRHVFRERTRADDAGLLAEAAARFARSNERLQRFCAEPLAAWDYPFPGAGS